MAKSGIWVLAGFIVLSLLAGALGSVFTFQSIPTWYASLQKPSFTPPSWVFGPVWTVLYILMGSAAYLVYEKGVKNKEVRSALEVFGIQLALNAAWSIAFFGLRSISGGLVIIVLLWLSIIWTMALFWNLSRNAALLLPPYILWTSFAALLNLSVLLLNH
jgi:tryptophan-rich sensory protein